MAQRAGKSRSAVTNMLRLMSLPATIQHLLADGRLSAGHARALLGTPDRFYQSSWRRAASEGWSVRAVEDAVRDRTVGGGLLPGTEDGADGDPSSTGSAVVRPGGRLRPPGLLELEELLADCLSTKVSVSMGTKRGKLVVEFADLEDLERLYHLMSAGAAAQIDT
ncbi:MAG: hypothetical protein R2713_12805 [Ilumatobacteraceae bacterium]